MVGIYKEIQVIYKNVWISIAAQMHHLDNSGFYCAKYI